MKKAFIDTETAGLHGIMVKLQWEFDNEGVNMMDVWLRPVSESMKVIEQIVECHVVAHNLRFDWFHISKWYNACRWILENRGDVRPIDLPVQEVVEAEWQSQFGLCLKPPGATCTLLCTQRGELQTLMNRKAIVIKRQPIQLRDKLMERLEAMTAYLPQILFAKREDPYAPRWTWSEIKEEENGEVVQDFVDIKLVFKPSNALKDICEFKLGYKPKFKACSVVDLQGDKAIPAEYKKTGYMPFARLAGWESWPKQIHDYVDHWANNEDANQYAHDDIPLLKMLYEHVGSPEPDRYGTLACQIASSRLKGMEINLPEVRKQLAIQEEVIAMAPVNVDSPKQVREYIADAMDDIEALIVAKSAAKQVLEDIISEYTCEEDEECCEHGCPRCDCKHAARIFRLDLEELKQSRPKKEQDVLDWAAKIAEMEDHIERLDAAKPGTIPHGPMPVIARVREIQRTRKANKRAQVYRKLIQCQGRMYPSFNPIGAKSGRLSGADGLNFQAIGSEETMRSVFTLQDGKNVLSMGDYDSLEIIIAIVVYGDAALSKDVEGGKSLHALMACELYGLTYEQVMDRKGTKDDVYKKAKIVVYSLLYGSTIAGIAKKLTLPVNVVQKAYDNFVGKYPGVAKARKGLAAKFTAISQPGGRGTEVFYEEPEKYIESMFGFRRDFSIEFELLKILFDFANEIPESWKLMPGKSIRFGDEPRAYWRHVASGLFGAAANSIQGGVIRAALNHIIQATGNHLTVGLQVNVWSLQPVGIKPFRLTLMSIHDELCVISEPEVVDEVTNMVYTTIEEQREDVPLLAMDWMSHSTSWAGKTNKQGTKHKMGWQLNEAA